MAGPVAASTVTLPVLSFGPAAPVTITALAAALALGGPLAGTLATSPASTGTGPDSPGAPAPAAPAAPAPAGAGSGAGNGPAGPDGHPLPSPSAATVFMVLIIPAGLLLALTRRQATLPAVLDRRGPHRPG